MELGDALQRRMEELAKRQPMIDRRFAAIAEGRSEERRVGKEC